MTPLRALLAVLTLTGAAACGDTIVNLPTTPSATTSTSTPAVVKSTIEFRVTGNASSVRIRYSSPTDGLTQVVSTLPYSNRFVTTEEALFLSLEATPIAYSGITNYPFVSAQILVNGAVFREATSNEFFLYTLAIQGTWRR